jgi:uncharacterized protein (TIRG00374 family)
LKLNSVDKKVYMLIGFAISILCIFFAFSGIQWAEVGSILSKANYCGLIFSVFFQLLSLAIAGFRWKTVINIPEVSWFSASASMMVGLMVNNILPGRMGEFVRPVLLGQETKKSRSFLFATVMVDRLSDLIVLVILGLMSFILFPSIPWARQMSIIGGIVFVLAFIIIGVFGYSKIGSKFEEIVSKFDSTPLLEKVARILQKLRLGFRSIGSFGQGTLVFVLSWLVWTAWFLSLYYALKAFELNLPFGGIILLLAALNLGGLVPSSPGYVGSYHLLAILLLSNFAIKKEEALSFILVFHALWYVPQTLLGLIIMIRKNLRLGELWTV